MRRGPARAGPATVAAAALLAGSASALAAQAATVQGIVQSESGELLEHVEVVLAAGGVDRHQTFTDRNGFYRIVGVAPGPYALRAGRIGYRGREEPLVLEAGERRTVSLRLAPLAVEVEGIVVTPEQGAAVRDLGRQVVTSVDLAAVPAPGGTGDLATYLRTLPGVTATGDRGGQLFVRGGTPTSNLVLVDGVPVYQPFHIVGFFSAFPEELVSTADFYAGGYGARYSGRTSSVLDVRLRPPETMDGRSLTASLSPFLVEALVEGRGGPFPNGSWLVSARRSLIEETSNVILGEEQPLTFESQLVKFTSDQRGDVWCSALALRTRDRGRIDPDDSGSRVAWGNLAAGLRCSGIWPNGEMIEAHMGYSSSTNDAVTGENAGLHSRIWRVYTDVHTNRTVGSVPVDAGFQGYIESLEYDMAELFVEQQDGETLFVGSAYAEAELSVGDRLEVRPGAVLVVSPTLGIEPRLRARWEPFGRDDAAVQGALGLYRQHAVGVSDLRDVGSVFVAWLEPETPMRAFHGRLGWQQRLGGGFRWSLEGFYNRMWDIPVPLWLATVRFTTDLSRADGEAYGADARVEYRSPRFYAYLGYGYGWTRYEAAQRNFAEWYGEPVQGYHPPHDRRHQLNAVASLELGEYRVSARWQLGSGFPFTRPIGFDETFRFGTGLQDVRQAAGSTRLIMERPFTARLPATHRLDVSAERAFDLDIGELVVRAGAMNTYDRRNLFYYDLYTGRRLDQIPLAPFVSVTLKTR